MNAYGITQTGNLLNWVKSFSTDRTQNVKINQDFSETAKLR